MNIPITVVRYLGPWLMTSGVEVEDVRTEVKGTYKLWLKMFRGEVKTSKTKGVRANLN